MKLPICLLCLFFSLSFLFTSAQSSPTNNQISIGTVSNGSLRNGTKLPRKGPNFRYFSPVSYHLLGRKYVHPKVATTVLEAYKTCQSSCKGIQFRLMETSRKKGGRMHPHRTHQNGLSVDFMVPKLKKGRPYKTLDRLGISHYLLGFTPSGRLKGSKHIRLDYNAMAKHLLALDDAARKQGLYIKKVIFKVNMQPAFFQSRYGKQLKKRNLYFVRSLSPMIDKLHDEHYHVDFAFRK